MEKKILYSAIVLTEKSRSELLQKVGNLIPEEYNVVAHHMTIVFGMGLPDELQDYNNQKVELVATEIGQSEFAMALKVKGFYSANKIPHITIGVNSSVGGKQFHSNDITDWQPLHGLIGKRQITLEGVVTEVTN